MIMIFVLPLIALALIIVPLALAIHRNKLGIKINRKKTILLNSGTFIGVMILMTALMPVLASAEGAAAAAEAAGTTIGDGLKALAAALSTGAATIGTGLAVGTAASAAIGATSEDEKNFTKSLIFVALGEGVAIYGLLISILILFS